MERVFIILDTPDFGPWMTNTDIFHLLDLFLILEQRIRNFIKIWGCLSKLKKIQISVWSRKPSADPSCAVALALNRPHKIFGRKRPLRTVFKTVRFFWIFLSIYGGITLLSGKACEKRQGTCIEMLFCPDFDEDK